ncbi:MAG: radical SAM protein [Clostridia bacterium]|jgi:TatD family-associated radical SAM protein|nr:radical SAM protein [Clostridia bacterium]
MQGGYSALRSNTYAYRVDDGIYINLTNQCTNACAFCIRNNGDGAYGSDSLWLEKEPSAKETLEAVQALFFPGCKEFVFCGYGEPFMKFDVLLETAGFLKQLYPKLPIRINTNGHGNLICGRDVTPELAGLIDCISVSLNTSSGTEYNSLCKPVYGAKAYDAMLSFASECKKHVPKVQFSVVGDYLNKFQLAMCQAVADRAGIPLRVRTYIGKNGQ